MDLLPLYDRVLIKLNKSETISKGGIIIPDIAQERATQEGMVVAIGKVEAVKVGDVVILAKFAGSEIDKAHIIVKEEDILAIRNTTKEG